MTSTLPLLLSSPGTNHNTRPPYNSLHNNESAIELATQRHITLTVGVGVAPERVRAAGADVLLAVGQTAVIRRPPEGDLIAASIDERITEILLHAHAVPRTKLGTGQLEEMGAEAMALAA